MKQSIPLIGGHVSSSGGLFRAIENGEEIGANVIQIYGASPRMWRASVPSSEEVNKFKERKSKSSIKKAYLHAAYLVNLASGDDELYEKSIKNLSRHLEIVNTLGAEGLVFHLGSGKNISKEEALEREVKGMKKVLKDIPQGTLIMENSAGGGSKVGSCIEEIQYLFDKVNSPRVKVCFDTAHAFEAGVIENYTEKEIKKVFDAWDKAIGIENIVVLHINDSKTEHGSHHDRHENIGEGYIGIKGFQMLAREKRLWNKAWILEVPGFEGTGPDRKNIEIIQSLF